jgi:hypothetical protein
MVTTLENLNYRVPSAFRERTIVVAATGFGVDDGITNIVFAAGFEGYYQSEGPEPPDPGGVGANDCKDWVIR